MPLKACVYKKITKKGGTWVHFWMKYICSLIFSSDMRWHLFLFPDTLTSVYIVSTEQSGVSRVCKVFLLIARAYAESPPLPCTGRNDQEESLQQGPLPRRRRGRGWGRGMDRGPIFSLAFHPPLLTALPSFLSISLWIVERLETLLLPRRRNCRWLCLLALRPDR